MRRLNVPLGDRSYDVVIGRGIVAELASLLPAAAQRVAIITQDGIPAEIVLPGLDVTMQQSLPHRLPSRRRHR